MTSITTNGTPARSAAARLRLQTRYDWIPVRQMFAAPYERPLSQTKVNHILEHWDLRAVGVLYLAERVAPDPVDLPFALLDGRHRKAAAEEQGETELPCVVYTGLTYRDEANLYVLFATVNRQTALDRFRARLQAGDPDAVRLQKIVRKEAGLEFPLHCAAGAEGFLNAVMTVERIYRNMGPEILVATCRVLRAVWKDQQRAWTQRMVYGMGHFLVRYQSHEYFDEARFIQQLQMWTPEQLFGRANLLAATGRITDARSSIGLALLEIYNEHLRTGKLPPWASRLYTRTPQGLVVLDLEG
jgi:hypothetical protein